jgi:hypothetical protein
VQTLEESEGQEESFEAALADITWKAKAWKVKCAEDTYNEETRIKYTLMSCDPIKWADECKARFPHLCSPVQVTQHVWRHHAMFTALQCGVRGIGVRGTTGK